MARVCSCEVECGEERYHRLWCGDTETWQGQPGCHTQDSEPLAQALVSGPGQALIARLRLLHQSFHLIFDAQLKLFQTDFLNLFLLVEVGF